MPYIRDLTVICVSRTHTWQYTALPMILKETSWNGYSTPIIASSALNINVIVIEKSESGFCYYSVGCKCHQSQMSGFRRLKGWYLSWSLQWRQNGHDSVSNHQPHDCLLNRLFRYSSKKTSKLRVTGLCAGNSPGTGEFPAQMASNAENVSIWWRHYVPIIVRKEYNISHTMCTKVCCVLSFQMF